MPRPRQTLKSVTVLDESKSREKMFENKQTPNKRMLSAKSEENLLSSFEVSSGGKSILY